MSFVVGGSLAGCGDDGGGGGGAVDAAPPMIDAPMIDAGNAPAMGLGAVCSQTMACPTTPADLGCVRLSTTATTGFCTIPCGQTNVPPQGQDPTPPTGGDALCAASMPAPGSGTVACFISSAPAMNKINWFCGIACGNIQGTDLGTCPGGLTCTDNICQ
jgi:hypothetical protein